MYPCIYGEGLSADGYIKVWVSADPGRWNFWGSLAGKGKGLNAINADADQMRLNKEFHKLKMALGLREGLDYGIPENFKTLNYGSLMLMGDADVDGYHIVLLRLLYFYVYYPSLLKLGFVKYLRSPLYVCVKGNRKNKPKKYAGYVRLYTENEFLEWKDSVKDYDKWTVKYTKGLGTTAIDDADLDYSERRIITCGYDDEMTREAIEMFFNGTRADDRKEWLMKLNEHPVEEQVIDNKQKIENIIHTDGLAYTQHSIPRAIPDFRDGLKYSQRKLVWALLKVFGIILSGELKNPCGKLAQAKLMKTSQAGNAAAGLTDYEHGEISIIAALIKMTQDFVGSNNANLFVGEGIFGTRFGNGQDAANERYTHLKPSPWLPALCPPIDFEIVERKNSEEHAEIESEYIPFILPMILINGPKGIATSVSAAWPMFKVETIAKMMIDRLRGQQFTSDPLPHYRYFQGKIVLKKGSKKIETPDSEPTEEDGEMTQEQLEKLAIVAVMVSIGRLEESSRKRSEVRAI